jgi:hypothetical protein
MDVEVISNQTFFNREVNDGIIYVIVFEGDNTKILKANKYSFPEEDDNVLSYRACDNFFKITEDILKVVVVAKNVKKFMIDYIKTISSDVSIFEYDGILSNKITMEIDNEKIHIYDNDNHFAFKKSWIEIS